MEGPEVINKIRKLIDITKAASNYFHEDDYMLVLGLYTYNELTRIMFYDLIIDAEKENKLLGIPYIIDYVHRDTIGLYRNVESIAYIRRVLNDSD